MDLADPPPDDPLAEPVRARLLRMLADLRRPAGTRELAAGVGRHPNGVRNHLRLMAAAGLVERRQVQGPIGRPSDEWAIAPGARPAGAPPQGYRDLGRWLTRAMAGATTPLDQVEREGRRIGRELVAGDGHRAAGEPLFDALAAMGFGPRADRRTAGRSTYELQNCPYRDAVRENPPVVCALHRGITRGLVDALEPGAQLTRFVPRDPDEAGCLVEVAAAAG